MFRINPKRLFKFNMVSNIDQELQRRIYLENRIAEERKVKIDLYRKTILAKANADLIKEKIAYELEEKYLLPKE
jgi:hypothetical protein